MATRVKRSEQIPLLRAAALSLAERQGEQKVVSGIPVTEVKLDGLYFWLTPFGPFMNLDVWDEATGGNKVLNMCWSPDNTMEVTSFRRGDWEEMLLKHARRALH